MFPAETERHFTIKSNIVAIKKKRGRFFSTLPHYFKDHILVTNSIWSNSAVIAEIKLIIYARNTTRDKSMTIQQVLFNVISDRNKNLQPFKQSCLPPNISQSLNKFLWAVVWSLVFCLVGNGFTLKEVEFQTSSSSPALPPFSAESKHLSRPG